MRFQLAAEAFRAGLKKFPDDPDLAAGWRRPAESGDREEMQKSIRAALAINPRHIPSRLLLANHLIDAEQYTEAEKQLGLVLQVNPASTRSSGVSAVLAFAPRCESGKAISGGGVGILPDQSRVDHLIGLKLSQKYRFAEGAAAQRRALEFEPAYLPAQRQLAEDLLRLGGMQKVGRSRSRSQRRWL